MVLKGIITALVAAADDPDFVLHPKDYHVEMPTDIYNSRDISYVDSAVLTKGAPVAGSWPFALPSGEFKPETFAPSIKGYQRGEKKITLYVTEWATYKHWDSLKLPWISGLKLTPSFESLPVESIDTLLFGFLPICGDDYSWEQYALCTVNDCTITENDPGIRTVIRLCNYDDSAYQVTYFDGWGNFSAGHNNFGWLFQLKNKANSPVKLIASIGGWTLSKPFYHLTNEERWDKFANGVARFAVLYPMFDGFDIDYEIPGGGGSDDGSTVKSNVYTRDAQQVALAQTVTVGKEGGPHDGANYIAMMAALRKKLDTLGKNWGRELLLTTAMNVDLVKQSAIDFGKLGDSVDSFHMMTYDFSGGWTLGTPADRDHWITNHSNLYPRQDGLSIDAVQWSVDKLIAAGFPKEKMMVGVAMYGRGWSGITGTGKKVTFKDDDNSDKEGTDYFDGVTTASGMCDGVVQMGVIDYTVLAEAAKDTTSCKYFYDECAQAAQMYCENQSLTAGNNLYTYENPRSAMAKGAYVLDQGLQGLFAWTWDQDNGDILNAMNEGIGNKPLQGEPLYIGKFPERPSSCDEVTPDPTLQPETTAGTGGTDPSPMTIPDGSTGTGTGTSGTGTGTSGTGTSGTVTGNTTNADGTTSGALPTISGLLALLLACTAM